MGYQELSWSDGVLDHRNVWGLSDFWAFLETLLVAVMKSGPKKYLD